MNSLARFFALSRADVSGQRSILVAFIAAVLLPLASHFWLGDIGLNLADEGFLWYGAQRLMHGEVPIRDFQSYGVGRYLWAAGWMSVLRDDGLLALRLSNAIGWALTTFLVTETLLHRRGMRLSFMLWVIAAFMFLWVPDFKWADSFAPVLLVWAVAGAIETPSLRRLFVLGLALGIVSVIGINHALYGTVGVVFAGLLLARQRRLPWTLSAAASLAAGALVGFAPVLALMAFAPGFGAAYLDSIRLVFETGTTNISIPLPRPWWAGSLRSVAPDAWIHRFVLGCVFVAAPFVLLWFGLRAFRHPRVDPVFAAAALLAGPYAHYAYSRADVVHVVVSAVPLAIAVLAFAQRPSKWSPVVVAAMTALVTLLTALPEQRWMAWRQGPLERVALASEELRLDPLAARQVRALLEVLGRHSRPDTTFFVGPYWPGAYAVARKRSPTWEIYSLLPSLPERQRREIAQLRRNGIAFALLTPDAVRADLGLARTHPLLVSYFERCMTSAPIDAEALSGSRLYVGFQPECE